MNILEQRVCEILDFPYNKKDIAKREASDKNKLRGTVMLVNGSPEKIDAFNYVDGEIYNDSGKTIEVKTLDVFLPKCGLYKKDTTLLLISRVPEKSWEKSFKPERYCCWELYKPIKNWSLTACPHEMWLYENQPIVSSWGITVTERKDIYYIYYLNKFIGIFNRKEASVLLQTNSFSKEEVIENLFSKDRIKW